SSPTVASTLAEGQNKNSTTYEDVTSPNTPKPFAKFVKPKDSQSESKKNKQENSKKPQVKYAEQYRHSNKKPNVKGNQRNWNNLKSYQLGPEFVLKKKACFNCGDFSHFANECRKMVQTETTTSQNHVYMSPSHRSASHRLHGAPMRPPNRSAGHRPHGASMRPSHKPAGHRPHGPSMNPMRPNMNGARPNISFFIQAHSYETRPFLKSSAVKTQYKAPWVPTVNMNNPPINRKFSTGNISYLSDFEPLDGGYVSFGQGGCKITGKGTIKTGKLEFENLNFVKDLKYNVFSMSQICNNKNSVLFTDSKCIVLGRNFKLADDANILLRTPRRQGTKDAANQEVKKDVSSLRYIALPNWAHDALLESSSSKPHDESNTKVPEDSGNPNLTASSSNPPADQMDTLTVESPVPTDSLPIPTACLNDSPEPSNEARLISKRVSNQEVTPSLDNILSMINRFEDILGVTTSSDEAIRVEADVRNMETTISASPTPTLRIHKDHPKSQIIGPLDTPIQTKHKSKEVEEQNFIATIYQKTDPALL
nr:putative ribonuclease H-like domain-containing protein [Tanacetum cinerariifolium]